MATSPMTVGEPTLGRRQPADWCHEQTQRPNHYLRRRIRETVAGKDGDSTTTVNIWGGQDSANKKTPTATSSPATSRKAKSKKVLG
jgi:hypothetical protein